MLEAQSTLLLQRDPVIFATPSLGYVATGGGVGCQEQKQRLWFSVRCVVDVCNGRCRFQVSPLVTKTDCPRSGRSPSLTRPDLGKSSGRSRSTSTLAPPVPAAAWPVGRARPRLAAAGRLVLRAAPGSVVLATGRVPAGPLDLAHYVANNFEVRTVERRRMAEAGTDTVIHAQAPLASRAWYAEPGSASTACSSSQTVS